jgi:acetylornithine deacetylase/succinyl-diaminopimelate desuccinylase-like protein
MNPDKIRNLVEETWSQSIIPNLCRYIEIPCKSPAYEPNWQALGHIDRAIELVSAWCLAQDVRGLQLNVHRLPGRTPLLLLEIAGDIAETIVMYGHLDKQPEMTGWREDLGPWRPVIQNERLYGRGGADDGYAVFASLTAIKALQAQGTPHARCVILIETCEESGSYDLPYYLDHLKTQIGEPSLVVCLDSGSGNYEQFWCTTSLRGLISGVLTVEILQEGVHSGAAGGVVPSSFRILRQLLSRIEDENTGEILAPELHVDIPEQRQQEAKKVAQILQDGVWRDYPWVEGVEAAMDDSEQLVLNRTWRPALALVGVEGIPQFADAGNVLRPKTSVMISVRIPPNCDAKLGADAIQRMLTQHPPYGAKVSFEIRKSSPGWNARAVEPWLAKAIDSASLTYFDNPALFWGEGGSIPFIEMLGNRFPATQFVVAGVLGPHSNAHGPNEFLDIPMAKKITCCVANLVYAHYEQYTRSV